MKFPSSRTALAAATVVLLGVAAGCGDDDDDSSSEDTTAVATEAPTGTEAPAGTDAPPGSEAPASGDAVVMTAESDLGTFLVDGEGVTLYAFIPDAQGPSTCTDDCLAAWPSLTGPATAGEGADESLLGTAAREDDGSEQVTYNGWPLYYFAQDAAPGDVNGQGVGDVWYVVDATGNAIGAG